MTDIGLGGAAARMKVRLGVALLFLAALLPAGAQAQTAGAERPPAQVGVITVATQDVPRSYTLPGRAIAYEQADIRPRISGVITEVLYAPGQPISAGAPMFQLDDVTARADLRSAEATVGSARAQVNVSKSALDRAERLVNSGVTQADLDAARADHEKALADLQSAEAALEVAQTQLSWTRISSPIAGVAGLANLSVGDLVTANQTEALATVTRLDPIDVDVFAPAARMLQLRDEIAQGTLRAADQMNLTVTLENGQTYASRGTLVASGSEVSTSTGTVDYRFRVSNPDNRILPGMFLRGELEVGTAPAILVPQMAAIRDRQGALTVWVVQDGKATQKPITSTGSHGAAWVVMQGLTDGETLVVDGMSNLKPGDAVSPVPVTISDSGVVIDQPTPAPAASE